MGQLIQLVLLASIVASCISYFIDSTETMPVPEPPVESSESDFSDFPTEFMNKLIASLSPEELEELHKPTILGESNLVERDVNTDKTQCSSLEDPRYYYVVKATDGEHYFVINNRTEKYQPVVHYVCDKHDPNDNKCEPADPDKFYGYCCHQHQNTTTLYVIALPRSRLDVRNQHLFFKGTNVMYEEYRMIQKDVLMNSYCSCDQSKIAIKEDYSCPNPESHFFI